MAVVKLEPVVDALLHLIPTEVQVDLSSEDPAAAVEVHFAPVKVLPLPNTEFGTADCSIDGYYESMVSPEPVIIYADDMSPARARFTILHELGHHLFQSDGAHLLDDLDDLAGSASGAAILEESACHQLAGRLLVPDRVLDEVIGDGPLVPSHIPQLRELTHASWEAIAVRAANFVKGAAAVVLMREPGVVSFCAAAGLLGWGRSNRVAPNGPLSKAFSDYPHTATPEKYRYGLTVSDSMFCGTVRVHGGLAVGILTPKPSDGRLSILDEPEPAWSSREEFCSWCGVERNEGWCEVCSGRLCSSCSRCGCAVRKAATSPCPNCMLVNPMAPGEHVCLDCQADALR